MTHSFPTRRSSDRPAPSVFFTTLQHCGALMRVLPELAALEGVPQRADYHPEVDSLVHTLMCVDVAARSGFELPVRYAALVHDLGKAKRSEERRVGKECVSTCRSRWSPYH